MKSSTIMKTIFKALRSRGCLSRISFRLLGGVLISCLHKIRIKISKRQTNRVYLAPTASMNKKSTTNSKENSSILPKLFWQPSRTSPSWFTSLKGSIVSEVFLNIKLVTLRPSFPKKLLNISRSRLMTKKITTWAQSHSSFSLHTKKTLISPTWKYSTRRRYSITSTWICTATQYQSSINFSRSSFLCNLA